MFNFGFDPEKYSSLGSSFDEPDPFAPVVEPPVVFAGKPATYAAMIKDISFDKTPVYDTQDEAVGNLQNFFSGLNSQVKSVDDKYADYNPDDYRRSSSKRGGLVGPREEALAEKTKSIGSYVKENDIPLTQVRDGVTYYLTTGSEQNNNMLHGRPDGGFYKEQGPEGTYSTVYVPPLGMFEDIFCSYFQAI